MIRSVPARLAALVAGAGLLAAALSGCSSPAQGEVPAPGAPRGRWAVDFQDGFSGRHVDPERWTTCYWWDDGGCTNLGTGEEQWYRPAGATVADGALRLQATVDASRHHDRTFPYASGLVSTGRSGDEPTDAARYAFTYGYVEVRFRLPEGAGLWPAIWMLPVTNRSLPEIDLIEVYGQDPEHATFTFHHEGADGKPARQRKEARVDDLSTGWHTIGLDWRPGSLRWVLDGETVFEVEGDEVPSEPMYLLADLAVGGPAGPVDRAALPATMLVDRVTVWRAA